MKKTKKDKKPQKLQFKLFSYYMIIPVLVLIILGSFCYYYISNLLITRESTALNTTSSAMQKSVAEQLQGLDEVSANLNYFNRKVGFFNSSEDLYLDSSNSLVDMVMAMNTLNMNADQINLYADDGYTAKIGTVTKNVRTDLSTLSWYEEVTDTKGTILITRPYLTLQYSVTSKKPEWYLSTCRAAIGSNGQVIGAIETAKRCKIIFQEISSYSRKTTNAATVCIFASDGSLIYPYDIDESETAGYEAYYDLVSAVGTNTGEIRSPINNEKCTFSMTSSSYSGWTYITIQRNSVILRPLHVFIRIFFLVILLTLVGAILLSWFLSRNMIKPVKHLKHIIQRMGIENLDEASTAAYESSYEELDELYDEFQKMSDSLRTSMQELEVSRQLETRSRVLALQAQMNPHFYYNTLSCISVLAENGHVDEVSMMCQTLSQIMRYITNTGAVIVSLEDEINHIRQYMYCMKIRYQDSLNFSIDVDASLFREQIPKLVIQPLVENAVKYGTDCIPPWNIRIRGIRTDDSWYIRIEDSGNGFSDEKLAELQENLDSIDITSPKLMDNMQIGGMGLVNIYIRWTMYCKGDAYFRIGNTEEGHHAFAEIGRKQKQEEP